MGRKMYRIYTDGACSGNPGGRGGWAAIVYPEMGDPRELSGREEQTTNNRMELMGAIKGLESVPSGVDVTLYSDSTYVINTMTKGWRRQANQDLWQRLDDAAAKRNVRWEWVRGHNGHPENTRADALATRQSAGLDGPPPPKKTRTVRPVAGAAPDEPKGNGLTHVDDAGRVHIVEVGGKPDTVREAVARGFVHLSPETLRLVVENRMEKGDVEAVARVAGIMAAKRTSELIPLCHPLPLTGLNVTLQPDPDGRGIAIEATARTVGKTGVEMEALTAVTVAALTVYDMCKAVQRDIRISDIHLVRKTGGASGDFVAEA